MQTIFCVICGVFLANMLTILIIAYISNNWIKGLDSILADAYHKLREMHHCITSAHREGGSGKPFFASQRCQDS